MGEWTIRCQGQKDKCNVMNSGAFSWSDLQPQRPATSGRRWLHLSVASVLTLESVESLEFLFPTILGIFIQD